MWLIQSGIFILSCKLLFSWGHWLPQSNKTVMSSPWAEGNRLIKSPSVGLAQHSPSPTGKSVTCSPQGLRGTPPVVIVSCSVFEWLLTGYSTQRWMINKGRIPKTLLPFSPTGLSPGASCTKQRGQHTCRSSTLPRHHSQCPQEGLPISPLLDLLPTVPTGPLSIFNKILYICTHR